MKINIFVMMHYRDGQIMDFKENVFESLSDAYLFLNSKTTMRYSHSKYHSNTVCIYPELCSILVDDVDAGDNLAIDVDAWIDADGPAELSGDTGWTQVASAHEKVVRAEKIASIAKKMAAKYPYA